MSMQRPGSGRTKYATIALLGSLCLFLSAIEYLIPKPLPFMRIGLANLPLLLALDILGPGGFFLLALIKVLGQALIGGTLFSYVFLFSFAGTFASAALMYLLRTLPGKKLGFATLGCAGAMASNGIQLVFAYYLVFGPALRYLIPPFLASGFVTGIALGLVCEYFCRHSIWYSKNTRYALVGSREWGMGSGGCNSDYNGTSELSPDSSNNNLSSPHFNADELFIAGFLMALIFLFTQSLTGRILQFLFFCLLALLSGKKINPFITLMIMAGIVFFHLLSPYGKVLAAFGPLRITQGSLFTGLEKAITLEGLLMLSRACIKSDLRLPGKIGSLLGESLRLLELMRQKKGMIRRRHIIAGIDNLLLEMETATLDNTAPSTPKRSIKNILLLGVVVVLTAALGFLPRLFQ